MKVRFLIIFLYVCAEINKCHCVKRPVKYNMTKPASKYDNPNFIRDRLYKLIKKPEMPDWWKNRYKTAFNPAWMDYCDPYHCNDYHYPACGLNRRKMKFKWFQSVCHIIMNNNCATSRGLLKYDLVNIKFCYSYVMYLRSSCPPSCDDEDDTEPVCGGSSSYKSIVLFKDRCALEAANCKLESLNDYEEIDIDHCNVRQYSNILEI